jgi:GTP-binding protein HflX
MSAVFEVLEELGVAGRPLITVFNKADHIPSAVSLPDLLAGTPDSLAISALTGAGLDDLFAVLERKLGEELTYGEYDIPYEQAAIAAHMREVGQVVGEHYTEKGVCLAVRLPAGFAQRWAEFRTGAPQ